MLRMDGFEVRRRRLNVHIHSHQHFGEDDVERSNNCIQHLLLLLFGECFRFVPERKVGIVQKCDFFDGERSGFRAFEKCSRASAVCERSSDRRARVSL